MLSAARPDRGDHGKYVINLPRITTYAWPFGFLAFQVSNAFLFSSSGG
ncbi:MAG: hypothetical protein V7608_1750 [Hyphomicrobiales bacterium]|jgi:hypothetical protein